MPRCHSPLSRYGKSVIGDSGLLLPVATDPAFPLTNPLDDGVVTAITELNYRPVAALSCSA